MNSRKIFLSSAYAILLAATPAFAVDTTQVYNSGVLVLAFLAFLALVVAVQLLPALFMLIGMIRGLFTGVSARNVPAEALEKN